MKKILAISLIIIIGIFSTSCSNGDINETTTYNYIFKGENDLWEAEYKVTGESTYKQNDNEVKNDGQFEFILTVAYKGDISELSSVKNLSISYKSNLKGGSYNLSFPEDGTIKKAYTIKFESDMLNVSKDEIIKVTIKIDNEIQELELKPELVTS